MKKLYMYTPSNKIYFGEVGKQTKLNDKNNENLKIGDIVLVEITMPNKFKEKNKVIVLSVVVEDDNEPMVLGAGKPEEENATIELTKVKSYEVLEDCLLDFAHGYVGVQDE